MKPANYPSFRAATAAVTSILWLAGAAAEATSPNLSGQLGILDLEANDGINPATGEPWKHADRYRFAFLSTYVGRAWEHDITWYDNLLQGLANASTLGIGADQGVTWKIIGSTDDYDARDHTRTNPGVHGTGHSIFLLDGVTLVAEDNNELWSGTIQNPIRVSENGVGIGQPGGPGTGWPYTGTRLDGTKRSGSSTDRAPLGGNRAWGQGQADSVTVWIWRVNTGRNNQDHAFYALSEPLFVVDTSDDVAPTLVSFANDVDDGPIDIPGPSVVYTVTFDEAILPHTVSASDFENAQDTPVTIGNVRQLDDPAVFEVTVTPLHIGPIQLRIKEGAVITDLNGNPLDTSEALADATIISVQGDTYPLTVNYGTGGGEYVAGARVDIVADPAPDGKVFGVWSGDIAYVDDRLSASTKVTMPAGAVTVTAIYDVDDGIPVDWKILYFDDVTHPDAGADQDPDRDGLTNLQEFQMGLKPTEPDTDNDGLLDADSITVSSGDPRYEAWAAKGIIFTQNGLARTFRGENEMGTDPLRPDTDGDGLLDGVETNTGVWVGPHDTGTDPLNPDTDTDGLKDGVETNTGVFVSISNTGTNPLNPDTDGDGVGDWYEIYASFTDPFIAASKPNIPYPLPDPDGSSGATDKPVKVYIMSGQSNMVGFGTVSGTGDHTLETMTVRQNKFPDLIDETGAWTTRQDVRYRGVISDFANAQLSPGALGSTFGPELGFGYIMGWFHDEPVLLLKSCTGNRSLGWDVLPPGSPSYVYGSTNYAGYGDWGNWPVGEDPPTSGGWYAGKEFDRFFMDESEWAHPDTAATSVVDVLDNWATQYPDWAAQGFEIAGFVWWQGDKDRYDMGLATRYEQNLVNLITSLRNYYTNRYPGKVVANAPFVLATLGQTPLNSTNAAEKAILDAQLAVDGESGSYPQFAGNVKTVYAHPLSEGGASNSHYNGRAGTYLLVGDALGRAMVDLEGGVTPPPSGYAAWIAGPFSSSLTDPDPALDFDAGSLATGIEWVLGGDPTDAGDDAAIAPTLDNTSDPDFFIFTYRRSDDANADANTTIAAEYGSDLAGWTTAVPGPDIQINVDDDGAAVGIDLVEVKIRRTLAADRKLFARLKVEVATP